MGALAKDSTLLEIIEKGLKRSWKSVTNNTQWTTSPTSDDQIDFTGNPYDVTGEGLYSLRILNMTDADIKFSVLFDGTDGDNPYLLRDADGNEISWTVTANRKVIITPDEIPQLKYLRQIKLRAKPQSVPTKGYFSIYVVSKG